MKQRPLPTLERRLFYKPDSRIWPALRAILCLCGAALIGAMCAGWRPL
jgi:hypothetical protein